MNAVLCVLFNDDLSQVLLTHRFDFPVWVLPGGGTEPNETLQEAIKREIKEEIGVEIELIEKVGTYFPPNFLSESLTHVFRGKVIAGDPAPSDEVKKVQFFPIDALPKLVPPPHLVWIEHALLPFNKNFYQKVPGMHFALFLKTVLQHPFLTFKFLFYRIKKFLWQKLFSYF
jgi:8-oxo-dGTP pyrophosphatase MutT (NUDIX family)